MSGFLSPTATSSGIFCCAYLFGEKNAWIFCNGDIVTKTTTRTTPMDRLLISRAFLLCTHVHLVTQESQLCSCLRKSKWNANRYHNDVHCTYCKHRTKWRISGMRVHYTLAGIKPLLKIGEGVPEPLSGTLPWLHPCYLEEKRLLIRTSCFCLTCSALLTLEMNVGHDRPLCKKHVFYS